MPVLETHYDTAEMRGNVTVPRNENPTIRGSIRRSDPDGGSTVPYFLNLTGKTLRLRYTDDALAEQTVDVAIGSNGLGALITTINAADVDNIEATERDGFLIVRNKNSGDEHYLIIDPFDTPADDAAPVLGLEVSPFPGSASYAGEVASSPPGRDQLNTQGTALIAQGEDLSSSTFNRSFLSVLKYIDRLNVEVSREITVNEILASGTVISHPISSSIKGFFATAPTVRLPVLLVGGIPTVASDLDELFAVTDANGQRVFDLNGDPGRVFGVFYSDNTTAISSASSFTTWGNKDGKSVYGPTVPAKVKHPTLSITSVKGNIVWVVNATFDDLTVQPGDPVLISDATNTSPFSHNGWFIVDEVVDAEHLRLRPMGTKEFPPTGDEPTPTELNPSTTGSFGDLTVYMGNFVPNTGFFFQVSADFLGAVVQVRGAVGRRIKDLTSGESVDMGGGPAVLGRLVQSHIDDSTNAHGAASIGGFTSATTWKDGTNITGATLKATIEDILTDLKNITDGEGGTRKVGGDVITISGASPNSLIAASLRDQLVDLLTKIQTHVLDGDAHAGAGAPFSGSNLWADGTSIAPGVTIDEAINAIVDVLGKSASGTADAGASVVTCGSRPTWLGGRTNPGATSVKTAIDKIINDLIAATVGDDGAERIGAATATDLTSGSVRSQLDQLAAGWGKLARANTWSAKQTVNGASGDVNASLETTAVPVTRKLLWEIAHNSPAYKTRLYSTAAGEFEITCNALWDGTQWQRDTGGANNSSKLVFSRLSFKIFVKSSGTSFLDNAWNNSNQAALDFALATAQLWLTPVPAHSLTGQGAFYTGGNNIKAWGVIQCSSSTPTVQAGYNVAGVNFSISGTAIDVDLGDSMASFLFMAPLVYEVSGTAGTRRTYKIEVLDANTFRFVAYDNGVAVLLQTSTPPQYFSFIVLGTM